jgi:hypothetical protein
MIAEVLELDGHTTARVRTGEQMVETLLASPRPLVVIYYTMLLFRPWDPRAGVFPQRAPDAPDPEDPWQMLLRRVDTLQWHHFIETRARYDPPPASMQPFYEQFVVTICPLPFRAEDLLRLVSA